MVKIEEQVFKFDQELARFLAKLSLEVNIGGKTEKQLGQVAKHITKTGKRLRIIFFNKILQLKSIDDHGIIFYLQAWLEIYHFKQKYLFDKYYSSDISYASKNLVDLSINDQNSEEIIVKIIDFFLSELEVIILNGKYASKFKLAKSNLLLSQIKAGTIFQLSQDISLGEIVNYYNLAKASEYRFIVDVYFGVQDNNYDLLTELAINFALYSFLAQVYTNYFGNRRKQNFTVYEIYKKQDLDILTLLIKLLSIDKNNIANLDSVAGLESLKEIAIEVGAKSKLITFSYQFKANFIEIASQLKINTDDLLEYV